VLDLNNLNEPSRPQCDNITILTPSLWY